MLPERSLFWLSALIWMLLISITFAADQDTPKSTGPDLRASYPMQDVPAPPEQAASNPEIQYQTIYLTNIDPTNPSPNHESDVVDRAGIPNVDQNRTVAELIAPAVNADVPKPIPSQPPELDGYLLNQGRLLTPQYHSQQIKEMTDRVLDLEPSGQNRQLIERVRAAVEETEVGVDTTQEDWIHVKDHRKITWGGRVQGDWVNWAHDGQFLGQPNYVEFRRLRLFAAGEGYGIYDYKFELEFAPEIELQADVIDNHVDLGGFGTELKDAYLGVRDVPFLGYVRFGHFKAPIGFEELDASRYITFMERSLAHRFAPGRELGFAALHHTAGENMTWAYGVFFDEMSESSHSIVDDNQGTRLVGRITATPLYDELSEGRSLVHLGLGYAYTRPRMRNNPLFPGIEYRPVRFDARPEIHRGDDLVDTGAINAQQYQILDAEMAIVRGPASIQGELVWTGIDEMSAGTTDLYGAYMQMSYFLTGEHQTYKRTSGTFGRVIPFENFWIVRTPGGTQAGWGAWEIAARWSYLDFSDVDGQQLNDLTIGWNWYWNAQTRMTFNWIHPFAHRSPVSPIINAEGDIIAMRLQVEF
ncbi:MAG: hypothetical protein JW829_18420 [Pirellulales bacterium]|nr:hypothetical protein [Pirellulales bacterium]